MGSKENFWRKYIYMYVYTHVQAFVWGTQQAWVCDNTNENSNCTRLASNDLADITFCPQWLL
jgi:hypothetical protein